MSIIVAEDNAHLSAKKDDQGEVKKGRSADKLHQKILRNSVKVKEECLIWVKSNHLFHRISTRTTQIQRKVLKLFESRESEEKLLGQAYQPDQQSYQQLPNQKRCVFHQKAKDLHQNIVH